jgi:hypothetical protein
MRKCTKRVFIAFFKRFKSNERESCGIMTLRKFTNVKVQLKTTLKAYESDNILYAKFTSGCIKARVRHFRDIKTGILKRSRNVKEPRCSSYNATIRDKQQQVKQLFESKIDTDL